MGSDFRVSASFWSAVMQNLLIVLPCRPQLNGRAVYGLVLYRSLAGIEGPNLTGDSDVCLL
jgi:hypothetical protein